MLLHRTVPVAALLAALAVVGTGVAAHAAGRTTQTLTCDGQQVTIRSAYGHDGDTWSAAQIVDAGTLVPVSFEYLTVDLTAGIVLDDETVQHGTAQAHVHQSTITCETASEAVLGDLVPPDVVLPPGVSPTDTVRMSFIATVVPEP